MIRFGMQQTVNNLKIEPLDMHSIYENVKNIPHNRQQDIGFLSEEAEYLNVIIYNEQVVTSFGRFIIAKGYLWSEDEERHFTKLLWDENVAFDNKKIQMIYQKYAEENPNWHLKKYGGKPLRLLDHIYQCMNPGSAKEILYKAGLDELAARLGGVDDYNMIGSSPADIFGGLTMRTLRAINHPYGVFLIETERKRQKLLTLQKRYAWMFEKKWNESMCRYMCRLLQTNLKTEEIARMFRQEYCFLESFFTNGQYYDYISRVCQREELAKRLDAELMAELSGEKLGEVYRMLIVEEELWNGRIAQANAMREMNFEYADEEYLMFYPKTIEDFVREAIVQKNCLLDYCYSYVENETDILFLRKKARIYESFVTVEIMDGCLVQAREKCNAKTGADVIRWIERRLNTPLIL